MNEQIKYLLIIALASAMAFSCKSISNNSESGAGNNEESESEILTVVLEFRKGPDITKDTIEIYNKIVSPGKLKSHSVSQDTTALYLFEFKNKKGDIYKSIFINDPLREPMEYVGDDGELDTKMVEKDITAIPLRINYNEDITVLQANLNTYEGLVPLRKFTLKE